jgi:hypothetical protein
MPFPVYPLGNFWFGIGPFKKKKNQEYPPNMPFSDFFFSRIFVYKWPIRGVFWIFYLFLKGLNPNQKFPREVNRK